MPIKQNEVNITHFCNIFWHRDSRKGDIPMPVYIKQHNMN